MTATAFVDDKLESSICLHLFKNVKNATEIREFVFQNKLAVCLMRPQYIWDRFHLSAAVTKALQNQKDKTQKTRSIGAEILYWISPSTNISDSLKTFGTGEKDTEFLAISSEEDFKKFEQLILGEETPVEQLEQFRDKDKIFKTYGLQDVHSMYHTEELLPGAIVSKIMTKEFC